MTMNLQIDPTLAITLIIVVATLSAYFAYNIGFIKGSKTASEKYKRIVNEVLDNYKKE